MRATTIIPPPCAAACAGISSLLRRDRERFATGELPPVEQVARRYLQRFVEDEPEAEPVRAGEPLPAHDTIPCEPCDHAWLPDEDA